jgi:hypothetical protein
VIFNSEIADEWAPPVRRRTPHWAHAAARRCHMAAMRRATRVCLKAAVGTAHRASRQPRPDNARRRRLAPRAVIPTASRCTPPFLPSHHPDHRSPKPPTSSVAVPPVNVALRRRPRAGEPPVPRSSPVRRRRAAVGSLSSAAAV